MQYLSKIESCHCFRKDLLTDEQCHQVAARHVLHNKVQRVLILEAAEKPHNGLVPHLGQNIAFCSNMVNLASLNHFRFPQLLHSYQGTRVSIATNADLQKGKGERDGRASRCREQISQPGQWDTSPNAPFPISFKGS